MDIFKKETNIRFLNKKYYAFALSILIVLVGLGFYIKRGFNMGIDFTGGTMLEVSFQQKTSIGQLRQALDRENLAGATVQQLEGGMKYFIKLSGEAGVREIIKDNDAVARKITKALQNSAESSSANAGKIDLNNRSEADIARFLINNGIAKEDAEETGRIVAELRKTPSGIITDFSQLEQKNIKHSVAAVLKEKAYLGHFSILSTEIVGPQVGRELRKKAIMASIFSLLGILLYIAFRFKFLFGLAGVLTLLHDVLVTLSFILIFNIELSTTVIAAILTLIGYSINDTIVIFDRLRDNLKIMRRDNLEAILDKSLNQTLSRTIITAGTVFLTVLSLLLFGGDALYPFSFTMFVGVISGSYSTIYQSCAWLHIWEKSFLKKKKS